MSTPRLDFRLRTTSAALITRLALTVSAILTPLTGSAQEVASFDQHWPGGHFTAVHPLTGRDLPSDAPYPVIGTPGDGSPDKVRYLVRVRRMELENGVPGMVIEIGAANTEVTRDYIESASGRSVDDIINLSGVIDLRADSEARQVLRYKGRLNFPDGRVESFEHDITLGNPEFSIHSTITSDGLIGDGVMVTSTVGGTIQLGFPPESNQLRGAGDLLYENFLIENREPHCRVNTSTKDGTFRVLQITFPDTLLPADSANGLPPPDDVLMLVDRGIRESGMVVCPRFGTLPLPKLIHFYAWFLGFHGGELGHENEVNRDRGGFVMRNWERGEGNVIAAKTYDRQASLEGHTFTERTRMELRWPE